MNQLAPRPPTDESVGLLSSSASPTFALKRGYKFTGCFKSLRLYSSALLLFFAGDVAAAIAQLLEQILDRCLQLSIATRQVVFRHVVHADIRLHAIVLHVRVFRV